MAGKAFPLSEELKYPVNMNPQVKTWEYRAQQTMDWANSCHKIIVKKVDPDHANKHLDKLRSLYAKYEETWDNLFDSLASSEVLIDPFVKANKEVMDVYLDACALVTNISHKSPSTNGANSNVGVNYQQQLPKINVPPFDGQHEKWSNYWTTFESIVHNRTDLPVIVKYTHLINSLKGDAISVIEGLPVDDAHYDQAIALLKKTFEDKPKAQRRLITRLREIRSPKHSHKELREFRTEYNVVLRSLENYENLDPCKWLIVEMLLARLNNQTQNYLFDYFKTQYLTFQELDEGLESLINILEHNSIGKIREESKEVKGKSHHSAHKSDSGTKSTPTWSANNVKVDKSCNFCDQGHYPNRCPTYVTKDDRIKRLMSMKVCLKCARTGHFSKDCKSKLNCVVCKDSHWVGLCPRSFSKPKQKERGCSPISAQTVSPGEVKQTPPGDVAVSQVGLSGSIALPTAIIQLSKGSKAVRARALFDSGSQRSFVHPWVLSRLNIPIRGGHKVSISAFGSADETIDGQTVRLKTSLGRRSFHLPYFVTDRAAMSISTPGLQETLASLKDKVPLADPSICDEVKDIVVVIGADHFGRFVLQSVQVEGINMLASPGGYLLFGNIPKGKEVLSCKSHSQSVRVNRLAVTLPCPPISDPLPNVEKLWELEAIGIQDTSMSQKDCGVLKSHAESVIYTGKEYMVRLPFKSDPVNLPDNYRVAVGQLRSQLSKLKTNVLLLESYHKIIQEYLAYGFIEKIENPSIQGHYVPHHGVVKNSPSTPIRIVFNCSSHRRDERSLNDYLETGPSLTEKLHDALVGFRHGQFAICADISKAFLRVKLHPDDRDFVRFLWVEDPFASELKLVTYRFNSVLFGSTASPFLLQATLKVHFDRTNSDIRELLAKGFYVDNFVTTVDDEMELFHIHHKASQCLEEASMPLQQWQSNSPDFNAFVQDPDYNEVVPLLGMSWNVVKDTISINRVEAQSLECLTKRKALSIVSGVFDPLGILSPLTIKGKLFIRDLWKSKVGWDDPLSDQWIKQFSCLQIDFNLAHEIEFPRSVCFLSDVVSLHVFCDASEKAYGAALYVVTSKSSRLLISKARVAPLKSRTIPQLELTALLVGCRLLDYVLSVFKVKPFDSHVWTDNLPCLGWVENNHSKIVYVRNRVAEIRELMETHKFTLHHVTTKENPADALSRGTACKDLAVSDLWFSGPDWLIDRERWPVEHLVDHVSVNEIITENIVFEIPVPFVEAERFSSLGCLLNVTKLVLKFVHSKCPSFPKIDPMQYWIKFSQWTHYPLVMTALRDNSHSMKYKTSWRFIKDLCLFLDDDGILRSHGRLEHKNRMMKMNDLIVLPPKSKLAELVVLRQHKSHYHVGVGETLTLVREEFWLPRGRQTIKTLLSKCTLCRMVKARTFQYPGPPPLPASRVNLTTPFNTTGVDLTGAICLKNENGSMSKFYVCLFTCTASRAVHLELLNSLSAEVFVNGLRRFVARCSLPTQFISDNGCNFVATYKILFELQKDPLVKEYLDGHKIKWHFNTPRAPWQGGVFERLIGVVKSCLHKALHKRQVNEHELSTILCEAEAIINNRPLTYISSNREDLTTLTPSMLLYGRKIKLMPNFVTNQDVPYELPGNAEVLLSYYNHISSVICKFMKLWETEYVSALREKHYSPSLHLASSAPVVDEIVLVKEGNSRHQWKLGRVTKVRQGLDGQVREVTVNIGDKEFRKPVNCLVPLELRTGERTSDNVEEDSAALESENNLPQPVECRPRRLAAARSRAQLRQLIDSGLVE